VTDEAGNRLPDGEAGELSLRIDDAPDAGCGQHLCYLGYIQPDGSYRRKTRREANGGPREWHVTGDRVVRRPDGQFEVRTAIYPAFAGP
jgi:acyl-coenzyme A synthetase/AMP-(fatty) acid ligase